MEAGKAVFVKRSRCGKIWAMRLVERVDYKPSLGQRLRSKYYEIEGGWAGKLLESWYGGCGLDEPENQENFDLLKEHLKKGSALVVPNHLAANDALTVIASLLYKLDGEARVIGGVQAQKHCDYRRNPKNALFLKVIPGIFRIETRPVVQHYDLASYDEKTTGRLYRRYVKWGKSILRQPGGVLVLAPEGTRSGGPLLVAQKGVEHAVDWGKQPFGSTKEDVEASIFPFAIIPLGEYERDSFNVGRPFLVKTIPPFTKEGLKREMPELSIRDGVMVKLGRLLPPEMWGYYAPDIIEYILFNERLL